MPDNTGVNADLVHLWKQLIPLTESAKMTPGRLISWGLIDAGAIGFGPE